MSKRVPRVDVRELDLALLDEPADPSRETMNQEALMELVDSIGAVGLIEPLIVTPRGLRYEVVAGHRRYRAASIAGLARVPCVVREDDDETLQAIQEHENAAREELNPGEQATRYARLLERCCAGDVDRLCALVRRSRAYVEGRLLLLTGDEGVLERLKARQISYGVAQELNQVRDPLTRAMYLDAAARGGASTRLVREWRQRAEYLSSLQSPDAAPLHHHEPPPAQPAGSSLVCIVCESNDDAYELDMVYIHRSCRRAFLDRMLASIREGAAPSAPR